MEREPRERRAGISSPSLGLGIPSARRAQRGARSSTLRGCPRGRLPLVKTGKQIATLHACQVAICAAAAADQPLKGERVPRERGFPLSLVRTGSKPGAPGPVWCMPSGNLAPEPPLFRFPLGRPGQRRFRRQIATWHAPNRAWRTRFASLPRL